MGSLGVLRVEVPGGQGHRLVNLGWVWGVSAAAPLSLVKEGESGGENQMRLAKCMYRVGRDKPSGLWVLEF